MIKENNSKRVLKRKKKKLLPWAVWSMLAAVGTQGECFL